MKIFYVCALNILDKRFSAPTAEGRILDHGFTKEEIPYIYMLPFKILKEPKLIMFQVKVVHSILPTFILPSVRA